MVMASRIQKHLEKLGIEFDLVPHPYSTSSLNTAHLSNIAPAQVAKAVVTHDGENYRVCVIPANNRLVLPWLNQLMRGHFGLVSEMELGALFDDCDRGAVPALGQVYGLPVVWDPALSGKQDIYIESGDHRHLIRLSRGAFLEVMGLQENAEISCSNDEYEYRDYLNHG